MVSLYEVSLKEKRGEKEREKEKHGLRRSGEKREEREKEKERDGKSGRNQPQESIEEKRDYPQIMRQIASLSKKGIIDSTEKRKLSSLCYSKDKRILEVKIDEDNEQQMAIAFRNLISG
mmetsp:Transcript_36190/g.49669  ORF Transcript_36190/g.49669 Transcript_36190/m.49669 type:complete len:119 (-) Transcript_36190:98-454(-)